MAKPWNEEKVDETLHKVKDSDLDCEVKDVESGEKLCQICPIDDGYCHCGTCEGCQYMSTEDDMKYCILN